MQLSTATLILFPVFKLSPVLFQFCLASSLPPLFSLSSLVFTQSQFWSLAYSKDLARAYSASSCFQLLQVNSPDHRDFRSKNSTPGTSFPGWPPVWICLFSDQRESDVREAHLLLWQHEKSGGYIPVTALAKSGTQKNARLLRKVLRQNSVAFKGHVFLSSLPKLSLLQYTPKILKESGGTP